MSEDTPTSEGLWVGAAPLRSVQSEAQGEFVELLGEPFYRIRNVDAMDDFFISLSSSADHWLFIATTGGLTAGRKSAEFALFPYYTVDRLTENHDNTGARTVLVVTRGGRSSLWEPFSDRYRGIYATERSLYKNITGTALVFEETNHDLGLTFRYAWRTSPAYGFVRTAWLSNASAAGCRMRITDGLQNILPAQVSSQTQNLFSVLIDAYKYSQRMPDTGLGIFTLGSRLTDLAEPSEALRANTVWQTGLDDVTHLLSSAQLDAIRAGQQPAAEAEIRGRRGAYFACTTLDLAPGETRSWHIVADVAQDSADVVALQQQLAGDPSGLAAALEADIAANTRQLTRIVASADGLQLSADTIGTAHHFANVMFNVMRGGVFANGYTVDTADLTDYIAAHHRPLLQRQAAFFAALPPSIALDALHARAGATGDADLARLCATYLPLMFSRRHGDPSRPWNRFAINLTRPDGTQALDYQGNWRDIFQNWEALAYSFPAYLGGMLRVFLNATTVDGYNPYRVTRNGLDWEVPEPDNPWSNIGYWTDHQIIYLQKLLEAHEQLFPGQLEALLDSPLFTYANVPYRLKPYADLLRNPQDSIVFDVDSHNRSAARIAEIGADGRLVPGPDNQLIRATLVEKLLSLLLAKLVNFVPEGGLWINAQRPEWNDANNALAGNGLSVVTVAYLLRFVSFASRLLADSAADDFVLSSELHALYSDIDGALRQHHAQVAGPWSDTDRKRFMDAVGQAGSRFREQVYTRGLSGQHHPIPRADLLAFLQHAHDHIAHTLRANRRDDGLYHAYNVLQVDGESASVRTLTLMLEGQVAVLSSGLLSPDEALALLRQLRHSALYRADQHSYILYPDRDLPRFLEKNNIAAADARRIGLLRTLADAGDTRLITVDVTGDYHFNGDIRNAADVRAILGGLAQDAHYAALVRDDTPAVLALFEQTFNHSAFTGRSSTFFAFEGLGSVYWHMIGKLLLAVQEVIVAADATGTDPQTVCALLDVYDDVRAGLGFNKSPADYGAFPTDPYSHTPAGCGAQQPGMTGLVKEEILTRLGEVGLRVIDGQIVFTPLLLRRDELLSAPAAFDYIDVAGEARQLRVPAGSLAFTFCQVPVVITLGDAPCIELDLASGERVTIDGDRFSPDWSRRIFQRDGTVRVVWVTMGVG